MTTRKAIVSINGSLTEIPNGDDLFGLDQVDNTSDAAKAAPGNPVGDAIGLARAVAGANMIPNGDLLQGNLGLSNAADASPGTTSPVQTIVANAGPDNLPAVRIAYSGTLLSGKSLYVNKLSADAAGTNARIPVTPGARYEASAYPVAPAGMTVQMQIMWETAAPAFISASSGTAIAAPAIGAGSLLTHPRVVVFGTAPANAAQCYVRVRYLASGGDVATPVISAAGFLLAPAAVGQTAPSPFVSPGVPVVAGGNIRNGSVGKAQLAPALIATPADLAAGTNTTALPSVADVKDVAFAAKRSNGVALPYARTQLERLADGSFSLFEWMPKALHSDIRNNTWAGLPNSNPKLPPIRGGAPDLSAFIQLALNSGEDISVPSGTYPMLNGVVCPAEYQRFVGLDDRSKVRLRILSEMDINQPTIFGMLHYGLLSNIVFDCDQPLGNKEASGGQGGLVQSDIIKYPWLINMQAATRARVDNVRMEKAWNGINASGNAGGSNLSRIEDGCINCGLLLDGPLDFFTIETWEGWVYEYGNTGLEQYVYVNVPYLDFRSADGLSVNSINMWMREIRYNNTSQLSGTFGIIKLDGGAARFVASAGRAIICAINSLADGATPLVNTGADLTIASCELKHADAAIGIAIPLISQTAGNMTIGSGEMVSINGTTIVDISGGNCTLVGVNFKGGSTAPAPNGKIRVTGTGRIAVGYCREQDTTQSGYFINATTNNHHNVTNNFFGGRRLRRPASPIGIYGSNSGIAAEDIF